MHLYKKKTKMAPRRKQQQQHLGSMCCHICGEKAIGINFKVPSCMSCKVFFRRNAQRSDKKFKCEFSNSCTINAITRKFCSKCRLSKCFSAGMKPEYICAGKPRKQVNKQKASSYKAVSDTDSSDGNTQIDDAELTESFSESSDEAYNHFSTPSYLSDDCLFQDLESMSNFLLQSSPDTDFDFDFDFEVESKLPYESSPPQTDKPFSEATNTTTTATDYFTTLLTTPQVELPQVDPLIESLSPVQPHQITPLFTSIGFSVREFTFTEKCLLQELSNACSVLQNPYRSLRHISAEQNNLLNISLISEHFLRRLVQMCSKLDGFRALEPVDQKAMLRSSLLEMTAIRSVLMYSDDRKAWLTVDDVNKTTAIVPMSLFRPFCLVHPYHRHQAFPELFRTEWKRDEHIFNLLTVLVLFTSRPQYQKADQVSELYNRYSRLLLRYCLVKYATSGEAEEAYRKLLAGIEEMRTLNVDVVNFYREYRQIFRGSPVFDALLDFENSSSVVFEDKKTKEIKKEKEEKKKKGDFRLCKSNLQMDDYLLAVVC